MRRGCLCSCGWGLCSGDHKARFEFAYRVGQLNGVVRGKAMVVRWAALDGTRYVVHANAVDRCGIVFDDGVGGTHAWFIVDGALSVVLGAAEVPTGRTVNVGFGGVDQAILVAAGVKRVTLAVWDGVSGAALLTVGDLADSFAAPAPLSSGNIGVRATTLGAC